MKNVFYEVNSLDRRCYEEFFLTEDILMEHAANSIYKEIEKKFESKTSILIVAGMGNNGADGIALARLLHEKYSVKLYIPFELKSNMAKIQLKRVNSLEIKLVDEVSKSDVIVDCLFGSGLNKDLNTASQNIITKLNEIDAYKIACDIPSGININGEVSSVAFYSDLTITMGALKTSLFSDQAKNFTGEIIVANLGVQRKIYETKSNIFLLEQEDLNLPLRNKKDTHKGSFGHLNVIVGDKKGAGVIAAKAAFGFGAGLVSVLCNSDIDLPYHIMQTNTLTKNCNAIVIGMGLGEEHKDKLAEYLNKNLPMIIDADLFYKKEVLKVLDKNIVLTPHPKEFCSLLELCNLASIDIKTLQKNRFKYQKLFCKKYPNVVLLLKGANVLIGKGEYTYINPLGTNTLAKAGSGDVLSGLIGSLLAQSYSPLEAAINASLAHSIAALNYRKNNYSLIPADLVEEIKKL